jgi:hypothetical protein
MTAKVVNIELDQGANSVLEYDWTAESTGLPIDLTGYTSKLQIRARPGNDVLLQELSTTNGRIVLGGTAGTITVTFLPIDTSAGIWFNGFYDLFITRTATNETTRVAKGLITVMHSVTQ